MKFFQDLDEIIKPGKKELRRRKRKKDKKDRIFNYNQIEKDNKIDEISILKNNSNQFFR